MDLHQAKRILRRFVGHSTGMAARIGSSVSPPAIRSWIVPSIQEGH